MLFNHILKRREREGEEEEMKGGQKGDRQEVRKGRKED